MFKRILVGFDGSEASRRALKAALELATSLGTEHILALTVVQAPEFPELEGEVDTALAEAKGPLAEAMRWAKQQAANAEVSLAIRRQIGHPAEVLVRVAEEQGYGLIVLGRRGHSAARHWLIGSTTDRVVDHAHCAVMIVH
jgi:nucleotide-binding universal stress UspA family protein